MKWLDQLKALRQTGSALPGHRQNRQNLGFVSFGTAGVARIPPAEVAESFPGDDAGIRESDAREAFEERAAIMEYDGGMSRADADRLAGLELDRPQERLPARWRGDGLDLGDLRPCLWCRNLTRSGRCLAAWRGELRAARDYSPTKPDLPQRCIGYLPPGDDPDQRPGRERWPELVPAQCPGQSHEPG